MRTAQSSCRAGLGKTCSHVAALAGLLFKIEAAIQFEYTKTACTNKACQWNIKFVNTVELAEISDNEFYSAVVV